jgi:hypothetical protein
VENFINNDEFMMISLFSKARRITFRIELIVLWIQPMWVLLLDFYIPFKKVHLVISPVVFCKIDITNSDYTKKVI